MYVLRRAIIVMLGGLLIGVIIGTGFSYWRRVGFPVPFYGLLAPARIESLTVSCSGSTKPKVLLVWNEALRQYVLTLQRSVDGSPWSTIGAPIQTSGQPHIVDNSIQIGSHYMYRILKGSTQISNVAEITVDASSCNK